MSKFKVGDLCYYVDSQGNRDSKNFVVEFYGTGVESVKDFPEYSEQRRITEDYIVIWQNHSWMPSDRVRKVTKLELALQ